ncbi:hypothetical protein [Micromonospora chersina]|uniref:hypothetical protein n=1 Tax=Micromonospora chersina TaxID=47854 RepID=UPI00371ECDE0
METSAEPLELAYYYSDWIWPYNETDQMKALLLFFDGLALALPKKQLEEVILRDPVLAQPLAERDLLYNLDPKDWMTPETAKQIRSLTGSVLNRRELLVGADRDARRSRLTFRHFIAPSEESDTILRSMQESGLISSYGKDLVRLPAYNRQAILAALAISIQAHVSKFSIQPITRSIPQLGWRSDPSAQNPSDAFLRMLSLIGMPPAASALAPVEYVAYERGGTMPSRFPNPSHRTNVGEVFRVDVDNLELDLSRVPLDEVLAFRAEHGADFRAYARHLRGFVTDLNASSSPERVRMIDARRLELADRAAELRAVSRSAFGRPVIGTALSVAGAAWTARHGNPVGALLGAAAAVLGFSRPQPSTSPYTYLFKAQRLR